MRETEQKNSVFSLLEINGTKLSSSGPRQAVLLGRPRPLQVHGRAPAWRRWVFIEVKGREETGAATTARRKKKGEKKRNSLF